MLRIRTPMLLLICLALAQPGFTQDYQKFLGSWEHEGKPYLTITESGESLSLEVPETADWGTEFKNIKMEDGKLKFKKNNFRKDGIKRAYSGVIHYGEIWQAEDGKIYQRTRTDVMKDQPVIELSKQADQTESQEAPTATISSEANQTSQTQEDPQIPWENKQETSTAVPIKNEFIVFITRGSMENHYDPSGYMGDHGSISAQNHFTGNCKSQEGCIQFSYNPSKDRKESWAGVYWQNPANNWGDKKGGYDLAGMKKLSFWARGEKGGEQIANVIVGGIVGLYPDTAKVEMGPITLSKDWTQYFIDLTDQNLSYINGAFGWVMAAEDNPQGCVFYLDQIKFEK